jgi:DNA-binding CsgD family transcriptional regulator
MVDNQQGDDTDITGLSQPARALYETLLRGPDHELRDDHNVVADELIASHFAFAVPGPPRQLVPIGPDVAVGRVLVNRYHQWLATAPDVARFDTEIRTLATLGHPLLEPHPTDAEVLPRFKTFTTMADAALFSETLTAAARSRIDIMQPYPTWYDADIVEDPATTTYMLNDQTSRGVTHRYLYDTRILEIPWFYKAALDEIDGGAQARVTTAPLPTSILIVDHTAALIACHPDQSITLYTTAPLLITILEQAFDSHWQQAIPLQRHGDHTTGEDPADNDVLNLVLAGHKNAAIARQLGLSPRTVSRHLQRLYTRYHVTDRAGLRARIATNGAP